MLQMIVALISFGLSGYGAMMLWEGNYIPKPVWFIVLGILTMIIHLVIRHITQENKRKTNRLVSVTVSIYGVLTVASFTYYQWKFEKFISAASMMKVVLFLLLFSALYLNYVVMRAETSYKKKRGNQRIKEQPNETVIQKWRKRKKSKEANDIYIVLGESAESED